jgi:4-alpha-glucanotransferase
MTYEMIRAAYQSPANICVIPMQDILNLDNSARMNFPGKLGGNWTWRFTWDQVSNDLAAWYKNMTIMFERPSLKKSENAKLDYAEE